MNSRATILVLFDVGQRVFSGRDWEELFSAPEWHTERDVLRALGRSGYKVAACPIFDTFRPLKAALRRFAPRAVFNLSESFRNSRRGEARVAAYLERRGIPFTGAGARALRLCRDKAETKRLLQRHKIATPRFRISRKARPLRTVRALKFPVVVKPRYEDASEGISLASLASDEKRALARTEFLHGRFAQDVLIEEYVEGPEFSVGVLGNRRTLLLPPREIRLRQGPGQAKLFTYRAKWGSSPGKDRGARSVPASALAAPALRQIRGACLKTYTALGLAGYARIDLRLAQGGKPFILEANPNPILARAEDFALSARARGISYAALLRRILLLATEAGARRAGRIPRRGLAARGKTGY